MAEKATIRAGFPPASEVIVCKMLQAQHRVAFDQGTALVGYMQRCGIFHRPRQVHNPTEAYFGRGP